MQVCITLRMVLWRCLLAGKVEEGRRGAAGEFFLLSFRCARSVESSAAKDAGGSGGNCTSGVDASDVKSFGMERP